VLFIIAAQAMHWEHIELFILVIGIHELGHYLVMRKFGYQNVRIFFIPFIGAAVSGKNFNIPGWQKAIVSLAGPVPGILLGLGCAVIGAGLRNNTLTQTAFYFALLNGFNLLPFLPLDGGWFIHPLLCIRHPYLDVAFRIFALAGILALCVGLKIYMLAIIGMPMLLALPDSWKIAGVVLRLRNLGVTTISPDAQSIPPVTAAIIREELLKAMPQTQHPAVMQRHLTNVFEMINTRPPDWSTSLFLLATYFSSIVLAIAVIVISVLIGDGGHLVHHGPDMQGWILIGMSLLGACLGLLVIPGILLLAHQSWMKKQSALQPTPSTGEATVGELSSIASAPQAALSVVEEQHNTANDERPPV